MSIAVKTELYAASSDKHTAENRSQQYVNATGLRRIEHRGLQREADWSNEDFERYSDDNGRSWSQWRDVHKQTYESRGDDEVVTYYGFTPCGSEAINQRFGHFVSIGMRTFFPDGHKKAMERHWGGRVGYFHHCFLVMRKDGSDERTLDLIKYEDGADFDPDHGRDPAYAEKNRAAFGCSVDVLDNGEIVFPIAADLIACCRIAGLDVNTIFPSCPHIMYGMIVVRGTFNEARGKYDFVFSKPVVISDLKSSRGVNEPIAIVLPSGRILAVFRGSNMQSSERNTRIEDGTPSHKWYCYSDDDGKTFTDPMPWHFDNREIFYSPASQSQFVRSIKNGKNYWIGNISDHTAFSNDPRDHLIIAEVNDRGLLVKDTITTVAKREEGDSPRVSFADCCILQDRETGIIEVYMTKARQHEGYPRWGDSFRYLIDVNGS